MRYFKFLSGDVDWASYGGTFYRKVDDTTYYVIAVDSWENMVGEHEAAKVGAKYNVQLSIVSLDNAEHNADALRSCGWKLADDGSVVEEYDGREVAPGTDAALLIVEALHGDGYKSIEAMWDGNNIRQLMALAKRAGS